MVYPSYYYQPTQQQPQMVAPQYAQPQQQVAQTQPGLKGRPVSSVDEARVSNIDFDGSLFIFPDIVHKKIYTKSINVDGSAAFNTYTLVQEPVEELPTYVTKEEFERALNEIKESIPQTYGAEAAKKASAQLNF